MQVKIDNEHAKTCWVTIRIDRNTQNISTRLIVETDLATNAEDPAYDSAAFDGLVAAVTAYLTEHNHIDGANIEPIGKSDA